MKNIYIFLSLVSLFIGCATLPPKHYTPQQGIAFRALELEGAYWDRREATKILDDLTAKISRKILASRSEVGSRKTLKIIHHTILAEGFKIAPRLTVTFGDGLMTRKLDCSDLTLIYLEVLERFGVTSRVALGRHHILLVLQKGEQSAGPDGSEDDTSLLFWETTTGKESHVHLQPLPSKIALVAVHLEMAQKLFKEKSIEEAEKCYRKAVAEYPRFVSGLQSLASFLARQNRFAEAEPLLLQAIYLDPTNPELYDFAAALYHKIGDSKRALEMCKKAFEHRTTDWYTVDLYRLILVPDL